jgi:S-adenosylmethionine:tRNA ribosyltransferase-isomerase
MRLTLVERGEAGQWLVRLDSTEPVAAILERLGQVPLPPYIRKGQEGPEDRVRYQTVYAQVPGAVAAPTAGLHFTETLLNCLTDRGVGLVDATLHVGPGTFRPIEADRIEDHVLHAEWAELTPAAADLLNARRARAKRIVAVGTTSARILETSVDRSTGAIRGFAGETALYIRPGHIFRGFDALVTNFHLPRSSLLVLVSAFAGVEFAKEAYRQAVADRYRFYSYGDAMLIV